MLFQAATHPTCRSLGLGTWLIGALEREAVISGRPVTAMAVEPGNVRARALYERLGYQDTGSLLGLLPPGTIPPRIARTGCPVLAKRLFGPFVL
jgi:ribosomal protein S18 acetylase RimI-like enzyme